MILISHLICLKAIKLFKISLPFCIVLAIFIFKEIVPFIHIIRLILLLVFFALLCFSLSCRYLLCCLYLVTLPFVIASGTLVVLMPLKTKPLFIVGFCIETLSIGLILKAALNSYMCL